MKKHSILDRVRNYFLESSKSAKVVGIKTINSDGSLDPISLSDEAIDRLPKTYFNNNKTSQQGYIDPIILLCKEDIESRNSSEKFVSKSKLYLASRIDVFKHRSEVTINGDKYGAENFDFFDSKKKEEIKDITRYKIKRKERISKDHNPMDGALVNVDALNNGEIFLEPTFYHYEYKIIGGSNSIPEDTNIETVLAKPIDSKDDKFYRVSRINMGRSSSKVVFDGYDGPIVENSIKYDYYNSNTFDKVDITNFDEINDMKIVEVYDNKSIR